MTIEELTHDLPWGLHDAYLEALDIDWVNAQLMLTVRLMMTEHQDQDQRARITVTGLVFATISPPTQPPTPGRTEKEHGAWINDGPGALHDDAGKTLPAVPEGCFLHHIYLQDRWDVIHICGRNAELTWLEPAPVASRAGRRAAFPGEELPLKPS